MHTTETILALIERNDDAVKRAIKALARVGFDGPDAGFLADVYRKLPLYDDRMTGPQYRRARRALAGYVEQLRDIANGRNSEAPKPEPVAPVAVSQPEPENLWGLY